MSVKPCVENSSDICCVEEEDPGCDVLTCADTGCTVPEPMVIVHGGAGVISWPELALELIEEVKVAAVEGYRALKTSDCVLDGIEAAVNYLEDNEHFNAGKGSVLNLDGGVQMDASIMCGDSLQCGVVTKVRDIKYPISLARLVMEKSPHNLLGGEDAMIFAQEQGVEILPPGSLVTDRTTEDLHRVKTMPPIHDLAGVGAVAINSQGQLAAAASTGGFEGKMGLCSDTCVIGAGIYADRARGAVSATGHGESIMKFCLAYEILKRVEFGETAQEATESSLIDMTTRLEYTAGAITIGKNGEAGVAFTSMIMPWAYVKGDELHFGINEGQHEIEKIDI